MLKERQKQETVPYAMLTLFEPASYKHAFYAWSHAVPTGMQFALDTVPLNQL